MTVHQRLIGEKLYHMFCIEIVKYFLYKEKLKIVVCSKIFIHSQCTHKMFHKISLEIVVKLVYTSLYHAIKIC